MVLTGNKEKSPEDKALIISFIIDGETMYYTETTFYELIESDMKVFETACEQAIFYGNFILYVSDILPKLSNLSLSDEDVFLSLQNLCDLGYITKKLSILNENREVIFLFSIDHKAFEKYLKKYYKNYDQIFDAIYFYIKSESIDNLKSEKISEKLNVRKTIVNHFLEEMNSLGLIKLTKKIRGQWFVEEVFCVEKCG